MDILERCPSEISKIPRVVTATFRNLLEKPTDVLIRRSNALLMIQCKLLQCMDIMETRTDLTDDPEYIEDFNIVRDILSACVTELTSFDEYYMELKSGRLKWSVVHTSKRFWVENAHRMNDNKYELLKILIDILNQSKDHTVLCIAAHDIGEYAKHYKRGKLLISRMGGKDALVKLLYHRHPAVKFHALKSLQVLMLDEHELYTTGKDGISERTDKIGFGL
ncbi:probable V-type proton ATPase subunit H 2 [Trichonephila clavata]|uniref:Probable V-type proton ATPase subunit H 2 n=1 Tax=Trichonephila clavata TaxID=2740835 RepID=A0A8X6HII3_TRICU|nr:probable V-type proton ATPase subunit H 2 [Trichonephila clavata]GFR24239.1 probable V-type proton ATPase subunit H 2 [Trichonephila clavata]